MKDPVDVVVTFFGGVEPFLKRFNVSYQSLFNYRKNGGFPAKLAVKIYLASECTINPSQIIAKCYGNSKTREKYAITRKEEK